MLTELIATAFRALSGADNPERWLVDWARGGEETASGEYINEENALRCPAVKAAVSVLAETIAMLPIYVYRREKSGKEVLALDDPLQYLLEREPNPETAAPVWKHTLQLHLGTYGNAFAPIQRTIRGKPLALWQRSPKPQLTKQIRDPKDGRIYYELRDDRGRAEDRIPAADMIHIPYFSLDGLMGRSPVRMIREAIGGNRGAERLANELFKNGGVAEGNFVVPGKLSKQAYDRLRADIAGEAEHGERHRRRILEEGTKYESNQHDPAKMQMIEVRRFLIEEIARAYRISPHLLQDLTHGTFSNITELGRQFIMFTMRPWFRLWEGELNRKLVRPPYFCKFDFMEFMRGDNQQMAAFFRTLFGVGAFSVNQILTELGYNELDDANADEHFIPLNMVPLSKATDPDWNKKSGQPQEKPGAPPIGDGQTPSEPGPDADPQQQSPASHRAALEAAIAATRRRLGRIEANAAMRAAKDPSTFVGKIDTFYIRHAERMREALEPLQAATGIADHVESRRHVLLIAAECKPAELRERVRTCVQQWS